MADYVNDKEVILINTDPFIVSNNLQNHLLLMEHWHRSWQFIVNQTKLTYITFVWKLAQWPNVSLYNTQFSSTVKYLWLTFNRHCTWAHNIKTKRLQQNSRLRTLIVYNKRLKLNIKLLIYKNLIKPMGNYDLQLWGNANILNLNKITCFQNIIFKKITNSPPCICNHTLHTHTCI